MEKLLNDFKICFTKGDTYALAVKMKNISSDLTTAVFTVKENADDSPLIEKTLGAGVSKIDDRAYKNEKTYKIQIQSEDTANLEPLVQYLYDFRIKIGNVVQTLLSGVFVVQHNISQVSTTSTTTVDVRVADEIESDVETTAPTSGIEYESDPVALAKIGDMATLSKTQKDTVVKAINSVNTPTFVAQASRNNVNSGENQMNLWGKVKRWFADLKALAFKDKVATADITDGAVTSAKIGAGAVTAAKISSGAVTTGMFAADAKCPYAGVADSVSSVSATDFTNAEWKNTTSDESDEMYGTYSDFVQNGSIIGGVYQVKGSIAEDFTANSPRIFFTGFIIVDASDFSNKSIYSNVRGTKRSGTTQSTVYVELEISNRLERPRFFITQKRESLSEEKTIISQSSYVKPGYAYLYSPVLYYRKIR